MLRRIYAICSNPIVIVLSAFALRFAYMCMRIHNIHQWSVDVSGFGNEIGCVARSIAGGHGFSSPFPTETGPTAWFPPVYPYLMAGVLKVFGLHSDSSFVAMSILDALFSSLVCFPLFYIGKMVGGFRLGVLSSWLWGLFPVAVFLSFGYIWYTTLSAFLTALLVWATLSIRKSDNLLSSVGYGLLWGFQLMTNAAFVSMPPVIFAWLIWERRRLRLPWTRTVGIAALVTLICCVPWTVRNYLTFHAVIPLRSNLGLELWRYNNDQLLPHPSMSSEERSEYIRFGEIQYMARKRELAIQYISAHPMHVVQLSWVRFKLIWFGAENPFREFLNSHKWSLRVDLLSNWIVFVFGLLGFFVLFKVRNPYLVPLALFPFLFPVVYYLTIGAEVYRHPIDPVTIIAAAFTLERLGESKLEVAL